MMDDKTLIKLCVGVFLFYLSLYVVYDVTMAICGLFI